MRSFISQNALRYSHIDNTCDSSSSQGHSFNVQARLFWMDRSLVKPENCGRLFLWVIFRPHSWWCLRSSCRTLLPRGSSLPLTLRWRRWWFMTPSSRWCFGRRHSDPQKFFQGQQREHHEGLHWGQERGHRDEFQPQSVQFSRFYRRCEQFDLQCETRAII